MQRGFAQLLLIFIAVIITVAGGYFYLDSKDKNPLPNVTVTPLKTLQSNDYANQSLGFTFTCPKGLTVKEDTEEDFNKRGNGDFRKNFKGYVRYEPPVFLGAVAVMGKDNSFDNNPLSIWVFNNDSNLTIEQWFANFWYYPFVWGVFDWTSKGHIALDQEATVSGETAKSKIVAYQLGKPKFVYSAKDGRMYLFRIIDDENKTGDQILSSFKFLK